MNTGETLREFLTSRTDTYFVDGEGTLWLGEDALASYERNAVRRSKMIAGWPATKPAFYFRTAPPGEDTRLDMPVHLLDNRIFLRDGVGEPLIDLGLREWSGSFDDIPEPEAEETPAEEDSA
jgi:hypothetical protein